MRGRYAFPLAVLLAGCAGAVDEPGTDSATAALSSESELKSQGHPDGEALFQTPFKHTNGRSCATCHVLEDHTVLTPAHVTELLAQNPSDPLFNPIDADDPSAAVPTYEHLKKGLVRVVIDLPDNMDLIDFDGNVVTPPDRTVSVWRAVPTVFNSAITAPYQYDGRKGTLQEQAQGAIIAHSQGKKVAKKDLDAIADFQKDQFTSARAKLVAKQLEHGVPVEDIVPPEKFMSLTPAQKRGRDVYDIACEACHGGATTLQVVNREVHDLAFLE
ncbi:MAG TPA: cytochrome c peroxidase, partial [Polyangiaceae bacterium]|nr:cytochrome c peroxidase [Polyangiaceae bacterium]